MHPTSPIKGAVYEYKTEFEHGLVVVVEVSSAGLATTAGIDFADSKKRLIVNCMNNNHWLKWSTLLYDPTQSAEYLRTAMAKKAKKKHRNATLAAVQKNDPKRYRTRTVKPKKGKGRKQRPRRSNRVDGVKSEA